MRSQYSCQPLALAASTVTLAWDSTTNNIVGYKIYYGAASHTYTYTNTVGDGNATSVTISNLILGATYYFAGHGRGCLRAGERLLE